MKTIHLPGTSLIICSRNRPQLLLESGESILHGDEVPDELLIMDQSDAPHPTLSTWTHVRTCTIRYHRMTIIGECPAKNTGIVRAQHDVLVFADDDILAAPTWFGALVRALLLAGPRAVVTGRVLPTEEGIPGGFVPVTNENPNAAVYQGRVGQDVLYPMNMAMYRATITEIGHFDERLGAGGPFRGGEDNDYGYRLLEAGYRIHYVPDAVLYHRAWRTARDYLPLRWAYGYCQGAFYAKHLSLTDRYILNRMRTDIARHVSRLIRYIFRRSRRQTCADAVYVLGMLYGATKWLITQRAMR